MRVLVFVAVLLWDPRVYAEQETKGSFSYYRDARNFSSITLNLYNFNLPASFGFWGFTDLHGPISPNANEASDLNRSFSEFRLFNGYIGQVLDIPELAVEWEYNDQTPGDGKITRSGLTYKMTFDRGWLKFRIFPEASNENGKQISLAYFTKHDSFTLSGFYDYNLRKADDDEPDHKVVSEHELAYLATKQLAFLVEYRLNQFEIDAAGVDGVSWALGIRMK